MDSEINTELFYDMDLKENCTMEISYTIFFWRYAAEPSRNKPDFVMRHLYTEYSSLSLTHTQWVTNFLFMQGTNFVNICYWTYAILIVFILIHLCILSLFAFNLLLILCLLLVFICIESLVAHAPLFVN